MVTKVRELRPIDYVNISVLGFGLAALSTSLGQIILPLRVLDLAPESLKNTYLGILTFAAMATAMLVQLVVGYFSDRTTLRWGRRRPYIAAGSILATVLMVGIGMAMSYLWLVVAVVLVQTSANIAQSPYDAVVKDQVPQSQRGRVSSIRAIAGASGAVLLVLITGFIMDRHVVKERDLWLWLALALPAVIMAITMIWTVVAVRDERVAKPPQKESGRDKPRDGKAHPQLGRLLAAGFFFTLAGGILQTYTLFFLKDVVELENPASAVGILAVAVGLTIIITLYPAGALADRLGRKPLLYISAALGSTGSLLFFLAQNLTHVVLIGILLGVAVGIFMSAGRALITDMVSERRAAQQLGLANFALLGGLAVAKLGGVGIDFLNGFSDNLGYYALLTLCAASFCVGALLINSLNLSPSSKVTPPLEPSLGMRPGD
ncbi:MAG: MFS transporter [Chloroflexi bacterium]|nr:MFS transporter [Chloroflexota bacterium]